MSEAQGTSPPFGPVGAPQLNQVAMPLEYWPQAMPRRLRRVDVLSTGAGAAETMTKAKFEPMKAELHIFWTRRTASADLRIDFHLPLANSDSEGAESAGIIGTTSNIVDANELIEHQKHDVELGVIRARLEHPDAVPDRNELHTYSLEVQQCELNVRLWKYGEDCCIEDMLDRMGLCVICKCLIVYVQLF